jgi:hypothetical protein
MTVRDSALVLINVLLTFYCGNFGDEKRFQILNSQLHIQGYLQFYLQAPHSATIQFFFHFFNPSLRIKRNALCGDHMSTCPPVYGLIPYTKPFLGFSLGSACIIRPCDISKVNNALAKPTYCCTSLGTRFAVLLPIILLQFEVYGHIHNVVFVYHPRNVNGPTGKI